MERFWMLTAQVEFLESNSLEDIKEEFELEESGEELEQLANCMIEEKKEEIEGIKSDDEANWLYKNHYAGM